MLARLCIIEPNLRAEVLESAEYPLDMEAFGQFELTDITEELLCTLDETNWIELALYCDSLALTATSSLDELCKGVEAIALNVEVDLAIRINAYLFLRSQGRNVIYNKFSSVIVPLICQAYNLEALAILLLDPSFPEGGLKTLIGESEQVKIAKDFSALIKWVLKNTDTATVRKFMRQFTALKSPLVTRKLIDLGLQGTCILQELKDLFAPLTEVIAETEPLFTVFFLDKMLNKYKQFSKRIVDSVMKSFSEAPELRDPNVAREVFRVFVAPALKAHPECLLDVGMQILNNCPHLLGDFSPLASDVPRHAENENETIDFLADAALSFAMNWEPLVRSAEELPEDVQATIKAEIDRDFNVKYATRLEKFIVENRYENSVEAKNDFLEGVLIPEKAVSVMAAINKDTRLDAQRKLHFFLAVPGVFKKILEKNMNQFSYNLERIIPESKNLYPELVAWVVSQTDLSLVPSLFVALTTAENYSGIENEITELVNSSNFCIDEYYADASVAFKQLPAVTIAMQLYYFLHREVNEEVQQYTEALHQATAPEAYALNPRLAGSLIAHRITKAECVDNPENNMSKVARTARKSFTAIMTRHLVNGEDAKIPFLRYILKHLMQYGACSANNTNYPDAPFIWSVYAEVYLPFKAAMKQEILLEENKQYAPEKMAKVNVWLKEQIFTATGFSVAESFLLLSESLRQDIFGFEGSAINPVTLQVRAPVAGRRDSFTAALGTLFAGRAAQLPSADTGAQKSTTLSMAANEEG